MNNYFVTLGLMYKHEPHPYLPRHMSDPEGYLLVQAETRKKAEDMVYAVIGTSYAMLYSEESFEPKHHPLGCLGLIRHGAYPIITENAEPGDAEILSYASTRLRALAEINGNDYAETDRALADLIERINDLRESFSREIGGTS